MCFCLYSVSFSSVFSSFFFFPDLFLSVSPPLILFSFFLSSFFFFPNHYFSASSYFFFFLLLLSFFSFFSVVLSFSLGRNPWFLSWRKPTETPINSFQTNPCPHTHIALPPIFYFLQEKDHSHSLYFLLPIWILSLY